jgi:putative flippase GtrA
VPTITVAYVLAVTYHFVASSFITFRLSERLPDSLALRGGRSMGLLAAGYVINVGAFYAERAAVGGPVWMAVATGIAVNIAASYFLARSWVFKMAE